MCNAGLYHWCYARLLKRQTGYRVNFGFEICMLKLRSHMTSRCSMTPTSAFQPITHQLWKNKLSCLGVIGLLQCLIAFLISQDYGTPALSRQRHNWSVLCSCNPLHQIWQYVFYNVQVTQTSFVCIGLTLIEALIYYPGVSSHFRNKVDWWFQHVGLQDI